MDYQEKINIYVPDETRLQLKNDAELFEIFKRDRRTVNLNQFLSLVLCGYYDEYCRETREAYDAVMKILDTSLMKPEKREEIADRIVNQVILPSVPKRNGKPSVSMSFKPTAKTEGIISSIEADLDEKDSFSRFFCRMLISYCRKPITDREKIVFRENYEKLKQACDEGKSVRFFTIWNNKQQFDVIPYAITAGREEIYNYLIGEYIKPFASQACTFRLNRIHRIAFGTTNKTISEEVRRHCDRMIATAPQYPINADEKICIRLNDKGEEFYHRFYYGRPSYDWIDNRDDGHYYNFSCSVMQAFHYFRRFDGSSAMVVYPLSLRDLIIKFHEDALKQYQTQEE